MDANEVQFTEGDKKVSFQRTQNSLSMKLRQGAQRKGTSNSIKGPLDRQLGKLWGAECKLLLGSCPTSARSQHGLDSLLSPCDYVLAAIHAAYVIPNLVDSTRFNGIETGESFGESILVVHVEHSFISVVRTVD